MSEQNPTKVVTGTVRLSYVHLFEPFSNIDGQEPRYSAVLLIPKSDTKTISAMKAAQQAALENAKDNVFDGKIPKNWKNTLHDGDEEGDLDKNPEYEGHMYISVANAKNKPGVVDANVQPILSPTEVYSGCYARASINAFAFNRAGNRGVSFGLNHVQKVEDGEPLDGRTSPEDDFEAVGANDLI